MTVRGESSEPLTGTNLVLPLGGQGPMFGWRSSWNLRPNYYLHRRRNPLRQISFFRGRERQPTIWTSTKRWNGRMARRRNGKGPESSGGERTPAYARVSMCVRARATVHFLSKSVPANPVSNAGRHYRRLSGPGLMVPRLTGSQPCTKQAARCRNRRKRRRRRRQVVPHTHTHTHTQYGQQGKEANEGEVWRPRGEKKPAGVPSRPSSFLQHVCR